MRLPFVFFKGSITERYLEQKPRAEGIGRWANLPTLA
jgi:hypothetical protein